MIYQTILIFNSMEDYPFIVRNVLRKGSEHEHCEDSLLYTIDKNKPYLYLAIFDGCSNGIDSHFASNLYKKIFKKILVDPREKDGNNLSEITNFILFEFFQELYNIKRNLNLIDNELLSTIVFAIINYETDECLITFSGDGLFCVNTTPITVDVGNAPQYTPYFFSHIKGFYEFQHSLQSFGFENIKNLSICSDGILTFYNIDRKKEDVVERLLIDDTIQKSKAMLSRKVNMLSKENIHYLDDLSIIRYIKKEVSECICSQNQETSIT